MIGRIAGTILHRAMDQVLIDVRGVGYIVHVSSRTASTLPPVGEACALYTDLLVREDLLQLFGFPTLIEKEWHRLLTSVQGIGAKASLAILGTLGAEGVGLYRSEIPFLVHHTFPSEQEQRRIYRNVLEAYAPLPVTMRTLDIGGDKPLPYYPIEESNPFLGWRGVRFTLDNWHIFLSQLRAMLRASEGLHNLRLLLPMVSQAEELVACRELLEVAVREVEEQGIKVSRPSLGVMVEVPALVYDMPRIARLVDFISIGSNDFTQYLLAVDRNNPRVSTLYDWLQPSVLRALGELVTRARRQRLEISLCGEMASEPMAVLMLVGMGLDSLSLSAFNLPKIKWVIRSVPHAVCVQLYRKALRRHDGQGVRKLLEPALREYGLDALIGAGE